jgi:hypothetical protein
VRSCSLESGQILRYSPVWRLSSSVNVAGSRAVSVPKGEGGKEMEANLRDRAAVGLFRKVRRDLGRVALLLGDGKLDGSQGCGIQSCKDRE